MRIIVSSRGDNIFVDDIDFSKLSGFKWCVTKNRNTKYAYRKEKGKMILMHRVIMDVMDKEIIDHVDHNGINNIRANLRICTHTQNMWNRRKSILTKYKYMGIYKDSPNRWVAECKMNGTRRRIRGLKSPEEAAIAYNSLAEEMHKGFAALNEI